MEVPIWNLKARYYLMELSFSNTEKRVNFKSEHNGGERMHALSTQKCSQSHMLREKIGKILYEVRSF